MQLKCNKCDTIYDPGNCRVCNGEYIINGLDLKNCIEEIITLIDKKLSEKNKPLNEMIKIYQKLVVEFDSGKFNKVKNYNYSRWNELRIKRDIYWDIVKALKALNKEFES